MRERINYDEGWLFHRGDLDYPLPAYKGVAYMGAKTERYHLGPAAKDYFAAVDPYTTEREHKSEKWEKVDLPHDYIIEGLPDKKYNPAWGFLPYENAWYIKKFTLDKADKSKRLILFFEGVAVHATVYLNGCLMKHNFCGYTSFEVDITDYAEFERENTLAVYVNTDEHEGWWYEGGGIYRSVWLEKTELVSVERWGVFVKPEHQPDDSWLVPINVEIRNDGAKQKRVKTVVTIVDQNGNDVISAEKTVSAVAGEITEVKFNESLTNVKLWSPDEPNLYRAVTKLYVGESEIDEYVTRFGFRYYVLDPDKGMFINGRHYKIKGVCGHADCGLTGKAVPDNIHRHKVRLMKEMGANGYRTSHYMQAEALMDALDENGFIVMDETRWFESTDEGREQLRALVRRDRNRPSVFFWSVGNEEPFHATEKGRRICRSLISLVRKLDDSRTIMSAVSFTPEKATVYDELDAIGINYNWSTYEGLHRKYPDKAVFASECCATGTTRGWYFGDDAARGYLPAYDRDSSADFKGREFTWKFLDGNDWLLGGYQWIAFEHRGEAVWPRVCSQSGAIDLFMQKKDAFYQNKSHWTSEPMAHLLPHWNFEGFEGMPIKVVAYTNCDEVELFHNGKSQGRRKLEKHGHGEWEVPYAPGYIEAVAYIGGKEAARDKRVTAGKPYRLMLELQNPDVKANGKDIAIFDCYVVDENGIEVPDCSAVVDFLAEGAGRVYSTGSDVSDHGSLFSPTRKMRAGRIGVAVKTGKTSGALRLIATADDLLPAVYTVEIQ